MWQRSEYLLALFVASAGAHNFGYDVSDMETHNDRAALGKYAKQLIVLGYNVSSGVSFGSPKKQIPELFKMM